MNLYINTFIKLLKKNKTMKKLSIFLLFILLISFKNDNSYDIAITKLSSNFNKSYDLKKTIKQKLKIGDKLRFKVEVSNLGKKVITKDNNYKFTFHINDSLVALDAGLFKPIKPGKFITYSKTKDYYHFIADSIGTYDFKIKVKVKNDVNKKNNTVKGSIIVTK